MAFENLVLLAPCHGLDDFPLYHTGDDAASFLACWTSLWHPTLLRHAKRLPRIERCDYPPDNVANGLFVLPKPCEAELAAELPDEIEAAQSLLIRDTTFDRQDIIQTALTRYEGSPPVDDELVQDFLAFGFTLLQVELLTQQMRYSSSIDHSRIERIAFEAAQLATDGQADAAREKLTLGHDALADERNHYYPVDVFLIDLTLMVDSTWPQLDAMLDDDTPINLIASGATLECLREKFPQTCQRLQQAIEQGTVGVAGGEYHEQPLPLMTPDSAMRQLERGLHSWQQSVGTQPRTFARRRNGIYPALVHTLHNAGFQAALHLRFDEGRYPESNQSKSGWISDPAQESTSLPCLGRQPLDANAPHTFLELPRELSEAMDTDFVAVRAFWHWPGRTLPWYEDLRRAATFGSVLGKFVTLDEFFDASTHTTAVDQFSPTHYRYPFLVQATKHAAVRPQQPWIDYWNQSVTAMSVQGLRAIAEALHPGNGDDQDALRSYLQGLDDLDVPASAKTQLHESKERLVGQLSERLVSKPAEANSKTVINPLPFARRILLEEEDLPGPGQGKAVYASASEDRTHRTLVDVPAMGFATVRCNGPATRELAGPELAEDMTLRNEFFDATIDEVTGALRSLRDHRSRTPRLSQQVGLRITVPKTGQHWVDRQAPVAYSIMAADGAEITANGQVFAEITTEGRMLAPNGDVVGEFRQRFQVTRGSRILNLEIDVKPQADLLLEDDPWNSYYASRIAFADESSLVIAGRHLQSVEISARRFEAPLFVHLDAPQHQSTIFTGGLPYHRRVSASQLDTLLVTGQPSNAERSLPPNSDHEGWLKFRLGIGLDVAHPTTAALDWMAQAERPIVVDGETASPTGWFFHVTAPNVFVSSWDVQPDGAFRLRLVESEGRRTKCRLHAFRPWKSLDAVTARGDTLQALAIADGAAELALAPYQILELRGDL